MIKDIDTQVKIDKQNINYYKGKGYSDINLKDVIFVKISDLQPGSNKEITAVCDFCGKERFLSYKLYMKNFKNKNVYLCTDCAVFKNKLTCIEKYGVEHQMMLNETKDKIKKTCLEKYGVENFSKSEICKKKSKEKCNEKYGVDSILETTTVINKIKETNNEKYGNDYYFGSIKFKESVKKIFIENYGVDNPSKSTDVQEKKLRKLYKNLNIQKIDFKNKIYHIICDDCGKEYSISFNILSQRTGYNIQTCTNCLPLNSYHVSGKEQKLVDFIKENYNLEIILNSRNIIYPYELDIYLPDSNLAFEFNGLYWHSELNKCNSYHKTKSDMCKSQGIQLIHIWEDDWIYKQEIVKSMILNKLGKTQNKIMARKCEIKEIYDNKLAKNFLNENHIQGSVNSSIKIGLFYNNELVSLMTFKKTDKIYELNRFCNKINTLVVGSASRLFKYFTDNFTYEKIISFSNNSYSNGNLYEKLNFKKEKDLRVDYSYIIKDKRIHKFNFRKEILSKYFDVNGTEHEICFKNKIFRIYDSGKIKFVYQ